MNRRSFLRLTRILTLVALLGLVPLTPVAAQDVPQPKPIDLPCATDMSSQLLGATPVGDGSQTLISARVIFGPNGSLGAHTHPGTLVATIESGSLGFTLLEHGEMTVSRAAAAGTETTQEPLVMDEEVSLDPGDGFVEMGMIHSARNLAEEPTTVLLSGLIETGKPLTACADVSQAPDDIAH
ncbi:MAG TPA: hypothetical protein VD789_09045 [Thermomicrobiales bacterium]|jgi:hypothetical protein|nr:hypothetical protein [Thermomicrobiales bacterium]